jgi:hypothetical protein
VLLAPPRLKQDTNAKENRPEILESRCESLFGSLAGLRAGFHFD